MLVEPLSGYNVLDDFIFELLLFNLELDSLKPWHRFILGLVTYL
jgi:hypothetical protein